MRLQALGLARGPVGPEADQVELDELDQWQELFRTRPVREVVECEPVARIPQFGDLPDQLLIDELVLEQLEHDPLGRQAVDQPLEHELPRDVDPHHVVADELIEAHLCERSERDPSRGRLGLIDDGARRDAASIQQLVARYGSRAVEDRLTCKEDVFHRGTNPNGFPTPRLSAARAKSLAPTSDDLWRA